MLISVISAVSVLLFLGFTCFLRLIIQKKRGKKSGKHAYTLEFKFRKVFFAISVDVALYHNLFFLLFFSI